MADPTIADFQATAFDTNISPKSTASISWQSGDHVLVLGVSEDSGTTLNTPTATGLTFYPLRSVSTASNSAVYAWLAYAGATSSGAVSGTSGGTNQHWGMAAFVVRGDHGIGDIQVIEGSAAKTITLNRQGKGSIVCAAFGDWNAVNDTTVTATPTGTVRVATNSSGRYTAFVCSWTGQGDPGSTAYGITDHTGTVDMTDIAVEIRGFLDAAAPTFDSQHGTISLISGSTATINVVGLGFQPKAIRLQWVGLSGTDASSQTVFSRRGVGFAVDDGAGGTNKRSVATLDEDATAAANCANVLGTATSIVTLTNAAAIDGTAAVTAFTADGFTLGISDAFPADMLVLWDAWGGSDVSVAVVGSAQEPATATTVDHTVTGFDTAGDDDQVVMFASCWAEAENTPVQANSSMSFGAATGASNQWVVLGGSDDGSANMDTDGYCISTECIAELTGAGGDPKTRASFTQYNTNGFRLTFNAVATNRTRYIYMALKGGRWRAGTTTIAGGTASATTAITSLPMTLRGALVAGRSTVEQSAGTSSQEDRHSVGSVRGTANRQALGHFSEHGTANAEIDLCTSSSAALAYPSATSGIATAHDVSVWGSDNFTLIVDTAGGIANEFIGYLAWGEASSSPQTATAGVAIVAVSCVAPSASGAGTATAVAGAATVAVSSVAPSASGTGATTTTAGAATVAVTGVSPAASGTGAVIVTSGAASVAVSGVAPLASATGAATSTAGAATVVITAIPPVGGTSGGPQTATAGAATVAVTGVAPAASGSGVVTGTAGAATVAATAVSPAASATGAATVVPGAATVAVSGISPSASGTGAGTATTGAGTVAVSGVSSAAAGVGAGTATAGTSTVAVSAAAPSASGDGAATASVGTATVVVSATSPDVSTSGGPQTRPAGVATVAVSGTSPSAFGTGTVTASAGAASVTVAASAPSASGSGTATGSTGAAAVAVSAVSPVVSATGTATRSAGVANIAVGAFSSSAVPAGAATAIPGAAIVNCLAVSPTAMGVGSASATADVATVSVSAVSPVATVLSPVPDYGRIIDGQAKNRFIDGQARNRIVEGQPRGRIIG